MRTQIRAFATAVAIFLACSNLALAAQNTPATPVQAALASLNSWLGANAGNWSAYLNLPSLEAELKKGADADPAVVDAVVRQLDSGAPGLELARFRKLRAALAHWADQLATAKVPNVLEGA